MKYFLLICYLISFSAYSIDEIKTKDLKNKELSSQHFSETPPTLTAKELSDLKEQIETIKKSQKESTEMLEELEKE